MTSTLSDYHVLNEWVSSIKCLQLLFFFKMPKRLEWLIFTLFYLLIFSNAFGNDECTTVRLYHLWMRMISREEHWLGICLCDWYFIVVAPNVLRWMNLVSNGICCGCPAFVFNPFREQFWNKRHSESQPIQYPSSVWSLPFCVDGRLYLGVHYFELDIFDSGKWKWSDLGRCILFQCQLKKVSRFVFIVFLIVFEVQLLNADCYSFNQ